MQITHNYNYHTHHTHTCANIYMKAHTYILAYSCVLNILFIPSSFRYYR